ncbi:MAG: hypothetical protein ROR55_19825 [Devosia sp.]
MFQSREVFLGALPPVAMMQILRVIDFSTWKKAYVACSGTFTFERAIGQVYPGLEFHGNDVSLLSGALAGLALGEAVPFHFKGRLAHWEEWLEGRPYIDRVGAMILGLYLGRQYGGQSEYAQRHFRHYEADWDTRVQAAAESAATLARDIPIKSYFAGDLREHLRKGIEADAGVIISAPFNEGWFEKWFRFITENIEWDPPSYDMWSPDMFPALLEEIDASGAPYVAVYRDLIDGRTPTCICKIGMKPTYFVYAREERGSLVNKASNTGGKPFRFTPVDIDKIHAGSQVEVVLTKAAYADYIKGLYLQETIAFTSAPLNFLVYIDDMLAGILSFSGPKFASKEWGSEYLYLLSDTCTTRYGRVAKLIAMLARCEAIARVAGRKLVKRGVAKGILTTVRSNRPASMKYRGPYKSMARREAGPGDPPGGKYIINYGADVRDQTPQDVFDEWFKRHFKDDRDRRITNSYDKPAEDSHKDPEPA